MKTKLLLTCLILLFLSSSLKAAEPYTKEEQKVMQRYYELFNQPDQQREFYEINQQVRDIMQRRNGRQGYLVFRVNEVTYEINMHRTSKALKMAKEILEEMKENNDGHFDMIYSTIATIYEDRGNYRMSRYYSDKAISLVAPKDTIGMIGALLGKANLETSVHPDEAIALVDRCQPLCKDFPSHYSYGQTMKALAYFFKNDRRSFFQLQEEYNTYKTANQLQDDQNDGIFQTINAVFTGDYDEAIRLIHDKSLYSENMGHFDMLVQLYQLKGDKDMAIKQLQRKVNAVDSLNANFIHENMNEMNAEMEVYKAQQQVIKSRLYWLIAVVVLLISIITLLFWRYFTRRRYQKKILQQNEQLEIALSEAKESDRMKTLFIEHVSHEIRTPLNVITGYAQVITNPDYDLDEEERNKMLNGIRQNTTAITDVVNDLLEMAQDESKERYRRDDTIAVNTLCHQMMEEAEAKNKGRLKLRFCSKVPDDFTFQSNQSGISIILRQVLSNALKFTKEGQVELFVHESPDHGCIRFIVTDTGVGIPKDQQEKVFERFYKIDSFQQGFGIGLSLSRKIATQLGGSLAIDKNYENGARMVLTLPISSGIEQ